MSQSGQLHLGPTGPSINTITGNPPSATVGPDGGGNLNLVGLGGVTVTSVGAPANTLNISVSGSGLTWTTLTAAGPATGSYNHGYVANFAGIAQIDMPNDALAAVGDVIEVIQLHQGTGSGFQINCNGTTILDGPNAAAASISYTNITPPFLPLDYNGSIRLVCVIPGLNAIWTVVRERGSNFVTV